MDPNATLRWIESALADHDHVTARSLRRDLANWLWNGGFRPVEAMASCQRAAAYCGLLN